MPSRENLRLHEKVTTDVPPWRKWGPYVSERSWGSVREDYSWNGDAWSFFPFEDAHKRVYRWGEDGIAGWCDRYQVLVFAPAFWNGKDPILKERLFGLSSLQGNHGEDVKEYYYHLDGTPTHSYMKYLYKYPQREFPYQELREANAHRGLKETEFELVDTGIFAENRYFDIFIEYAKASPEDTCIRIEAFNRADEAAPLHIIPQLFFRNQWAWGDSPLPAPKITKNPKEMCLIADDKALASPPSLPFDYHLGKRYLYASENGKALFTNHENPHHDPQYNKGAFHEAIIRGKDSTNPEETGTKACIDYVFENVPPHQSVVVYLRFSDHPLENPLRDIDAIITERKHEADEFYAELHPAGTSEEEKLIQRQAIAGMLWNKQFYYFDVNLWLKGDNTKMPPPTSRYAIRNIHWRHLNSMRIFSMPDKWEYPWFAAWDLAFQSLSLGLVDLEFAKEQMWLLIFEQFQHPNGAIPAYEWEFSDLNPPVQAWALLQLYTMQKEREGIEDTDFLERCFLKLIMNFAWWVNRVDSSGCNVFEGGFLGLDNITLIDRSRDFVKGATLRQSDGTGWMALFSLTLMRIALILAKRTKTYEAMATKFFQHFIYIAAAMKIRDNQNYELWSEKDGFFYDVLCYPDGKFSKFRVRSLVGLIPLYANEIITEEELEEFPEFKKNFLWFLKNRKNLTNECVIPFQKGHAKDYLLSLVSEEQFKRILTYIWDPKEFRSDWGLRSLSKFHETHPFFYKDRQISYEPGDSLDRVKGGNSNWRGPIWFPTTYLLIHSLKKFSLALSEDFTIAIPGEKPANVEAITYYFVDRLIALFRKDSVGIRPFLGHSFPMAKDPHFQDHIQFNEFFHAETGKGLGSSHQTGWTGLVANLIQEFKR